MERWADYAGKRINDLSFPLAKAGISIFYLSTYQADYILVSFCPSLRTDART
jgi:hypothetical protein